MSSIIILCLLNLWCKYDAVVQVIITGCSDVEFPTEEREENLLQKCPFWRESENESLPGAPVEAHVLRRVEERLAQTHYPCVVATRRWEAIVVRQVEWVAQHCHVLFRRRAPLAQPAIKDVLNAHCRMCWRRRSTWRPVEWGQWELLNARSQCVFQIVRHLCITWTSIFLLLCTWERIRYCTRGV